MSDFKREERYVVIKISDLDGGQLSVLNHILHKWNIRRRESVVVETDWPIYEDVWDMIKSIDSEKEVTIMAPSSQAMEAHNDIINETIKTNSRHRQELFNQHGKDHAD